MKTNSLYQYVWAGVAAGLSWIATASAADVQLLGVMKSQSARQTTSGAPVLDGAFQFQVMVELGNDANLNSCSARRPDGSTLVVAKDPEDGWRYRASAATQSALNAQFPDGDYQLVVNTVHDGARTVTVHLAGDLYPTAPQIANFDAAQAINPAADFQVSWAAFAGGTATDFIQFSISDDWGNEMFSSVPMPGAPGALDGTATGIVIPRGTLQAGTSYEFELMFFKGVSMDAANYPGAVAVAGYYVRTTAPVQTLSSDIGLLGVVKSRTARQTDNSGPVLDAGVEFHLKVKPDDDSLLNSFSLRLPNGQTLMIPNDPEDGWGYRASADSQSALNAQFPNGDYQLTVNTAHDGTHTITVPLTGDAYPAAPKVVNFDAAQSINPALDFQVNWEALSGGTATDWILFQVRDEQDNDVFSTGELGKDAVYLDGRATGVVIPRGTLQPGGTYYCELMFFKVTGLDTTSYPGTLGIAGYRAQTELTIHTFSSDIHLLGVVKGRSARQANSGAPVMDAGLKFQVFVDMDDDANLNSYSTRLPNGQTLVLANDPEEGWGYDASAGTQSALDAQFPNGDYQLTVNTAHDGTHTVAVSLTGDAYPAAPRVVNFDAAQAINASADFVVSWEAMSGGTDTDYIQFQVRDDQDNEVFSSGELGKDAMHLDGTATGVVIPRGTLQAGRSYSCELMFAKITGLDTTSYPGTLAIAGYFAYTDLSIQSQAVDISRIRVMKWQTASQTSESDPAPLPVFGLTAEILGDNTGVINSATVRAPNNQTYNLTPQASGWYFKTNVTDQGTLDSRFPNGDYVVTVTRAGNVVNAVTITLTGDNYPPAPRISNYDWAQVIDPASDCWLSWDPMAGGTDNDFILFQLYDGPNAVFSSGLDKDAPGALHGWDTSVRIPQGTFQLGHEYHAIVLFFKTTFTDTFSYPGAVDMAGYYRLTQFPVHLQSRDVRSLSLHVGLNYSQNDTGAPTLNGYNMEAFLDLATPGAVTSASLRLPNGQVLPLAANASGQSLSYFESFDTETELYERFPFGNYQWTITGQNEGTKTASMAFESIDPLPPLHLNNYSQLAALNPGR